VSRASRIAHAGLPFADPVSIGAVEAAVAALPVAAGGTIVDIGCGTGGMLIRAVAAHPGTAGLGIDLDEQAVAEARSAGRPGVRFEVGDAAEVAGPFAAAICVGASHALGGFPAALDALAALAPSVLYGEGFWRRRPSEAFLAALGGASEDELASLEGLRTAIAARGFTVVHESIAGDADWATYEETLAANAVRDGRPDSLAYARRIADRRALPDGTDTLGFALFVLTR
jgi:SAM-dependent methyltransferase